MQCLDQLKYVLAVTKKVYNNDSITSAIKSATKKKNNLSIEQIVSDAYQILIKTPSDERRQKPTVQEKMDPGKVQEELLKKVTKL